MISGTLKSSHGKGAGAAGLTRRFFTFSPGRGLESGAENAYCQCMLRLKNVAR